MQLDSHASCLERDQEHCRGSRAGAAQLLYGCAAGLRDRQAGRSFGAYLRMVKKLKSYTRTTDRNALEILCIGYL
eukprot:1160781-Pelagomonas_calceolata.AAC.3